MKTKSAVRWDFRRIARTAAVGAAAVLVGLPSLTQAQVMLFTPARRSGTAGAIITFDIAVDHGIRDAVGWGTEVLLSNTNMLEFVTDFGGTGKPFLSTQPFFDTNVSSPFTAGSGNLNLSFLNLTQGATFGQNDYVVLGQFQVRLKNDAVSGQQWIYPSFPGVNITFADIGIPPDGTSVQDGDGNNMLLGLEHAHVGPRPPAPEPAGWLAMLGGVGMAAFALRRRRSSPRNKFLG